MAKLQSRSMKVQRRSRRSATRAARAHTALGISILFRAKPKHVFLPYALRASTQSTDSREVSLSPPTCAQPSRLVSLGPGGIPEGADTKKAHLPLYRLLYVSLVPRHGARIVRELNCRRYSEPVLRQHQSRS